MLNRIAELLPCPPMYKNPQSSARTTASAARCAFAACLAAAAFVSLAPAAARAQTGSALLLEPFPTELRLDVDADAYLMQKGHAKGSDADFQLGIVETKGRLRLEPGNVASPRLGYAFKYFNVDSDVPGLPEHLFDQSVGFATPIAKYDEWIVGLSLGLGYAGPTPFGDGDAWYGLGSLVVFKQLSETDALAVGIDYNGNRTFEPELPLPGFAYIKRIQKDLLLTVGVPITSIEWKPNEQWRLELGYELTDNITARVGYEPKKGLEIYGSVAQRSDAFYLEGQQHNDDRLLFQQRRAEVGVTWRAKDTGVGDQDLEISAAVGYAWDGEFSIGYDNSDSDLLTDVSDEPYVRVGLQMRF